MLFIGADNTYHALPDSVLEVLASDKTDAVLDILHDLLDCSMVQSVPLPPDSECEMWIDDEGKLTGKPVNIIASMVFGSHIHGDWIVGNAVLLRKGTVK